MKQMTIGKRIAFGLAGSLAITLVLGILSYQSFVKVSTRAEYLITDPIPGTVSILKIAAVLNESLGLVQAHINTRTERQSYAALISANTTSLEMLVKEYEASITTPEDREMFATFTNHRTTFVQTFKAVLALSSENKTEEANQLTQEKLMPSFKAANDVLEKLIAFNEANLRKATVDIQGAVSVGQKGVAIGLSCAVLAGVVLSWFIISGITETLRRTSEALNHSASQAAAFAAQVAATSQKLAEGASEQAASLEETSASLEEMTSMVKRNAESAVKAKTVANETRVAADVGTTDMAYMKQAMNEIKVSSSEVAKIVKDIDEIAFQTNILALNAAVEAARAGEAGMGFAVVADEVRNLAQRSAKSAKETAAKIEDAIAKSERGVQISAKVAASFEQIATKTREVDQYVAEIASASQEQAQGVSQVSTAVTQMDKVTQSNAASAEESASASEELNSQAAAVKESVLLLQQLVGGGDTRTASTRQTPTRQVNPSRPSTNSVRKVDGAPKRNGHAPAFALAGHRGKLPMPGDDNFKDF
ncbi:MAG: chemotaxis protein [Verrucomicrobia bacterium]|nr:chemotaxis protein [Verrucomicrobiota bacterium]